jgi:hypothetical protein
MSTPGFHPNRGSVKPVVVLASIAKWEIRIRSGRDDMGRGVTHLGSCYSDGESSKTCSLHT